MISIQSLGEDNDKIYRDQSFSNGNRRYGQYNQLLGLKILSFIIYAVIAYFTYKGVKIVRWLMAAIVLLTGIHAAILGIFGIGWHQYFLKPNFIVFGLYFIFGGIVGGIVLFRIKNSEFLTSASRGTG